MNRPAHFFSFDIIIHLKGQTSKAFIFYKQNNMLVYSPQVKGVCVDIACVCAVGFII